MKNKCHIQSSLFEKILLEDNIKLSAKELKHIDECESCKEEFAKYNYMESSLDKEKEMIIAGNIEKVDIPDLSQIIPAASTLSNHFSLQSTKQFSLALKFTFAFAMAVICFLLVNTFFANEKIRDKSLNYVLADGKLKIDYKKNVLPLEQLILSENTATIKRDDLIVLYLTNATILIDESGVDLRSGKVKVWVKKKGTNFLVKTKFADFKAIGTKFTVQYQDSVGVNLTVEEGKVWVSSPQIKCVARKGNVLSISKTGKLMRNKNIFSINSKTSKRDAVKKSISEQKNTVQSQVNKNTKVFKEKIENKTEKRENNAEKGVDHTEYLPERKGNFLDSVNSDN